MKTNKHIFADIFRSTRVLDWFIIIFSITVAVFSGIAVYAEKSGTPMLIIESPKGQWLYDLEKNRSVNIQGPEGFTTVEIKNGSAFITDSPCLNRTCIAARPISRPGEWIACMPNQVFVRIDGKTNNQAVDITGF